MTDPFGPVQIPRDRFGRPLIVPPGGGKPVAYTRVTTYVGALEDRYNLGQWEMRMVALGLSRRPDLVLAAASMTAEDKDELNKVTAAAKEVAAAGAAANIGTALHKLTERLDRGEDVGEVPDAYRGDLDAYMRAMAPLKVLEVERFTVLDSLRIAGTPDLVVEYDGQRFIADKKTGSLDYGQLKIAMQLAVYAQSLGYSAETGERFPLHVDTERAIVIHLPAGAGRCELKWVNIARGWDAVQVAKDVREWRAVKGLMWSMDPVEVLREGGFEVEPVIDITHGSGINVMWAVESAPSEGALGDLWRAHRDTWTDAHTAAARKRKAELHQAGLRDAEARASA